MNDIDIRPVEDHEHRQAADAFRAALLTGAASDEMMEAGRASWSDGDWLGAWDGDRCVGNLGAFRFETHGSRWRAAVDGRLFAGRRAAHAHAVRAC